MASAHILLADGALIVAVLSLNQSNPLGVYGNQGCHVSYRVAVAPFQKSLIGFGIFDNYSQTGR